MARLTCRLVPSHACLSRGMTRADIRLSISEIHHHD